MEKLEKLITLKKIEKEYEKDGKIEKYYRYKIVAENGKSAYIKALDITSKENLDEIIEYLNENLNK